MMLSSLPLLIFIFCMAAAVVTDLLFMIIPNRLVGCVVVAFALHVFIAGLSASEFLSHVAIGAVAFVVVFGLFGMGWIGGGDAKLIAASSLWFGPSDVLLDYIILASLLGGVLTLVLMAARGLLSPRTGQPSLDRLLDTKSGIPYGVALGFAGIAICLGSNEAQRVLALV